MTRLIATGTAILILASTACRADDLALLNQTLQNACPAGTGVSLRQLPALDAAASALSSGVALDDALSQVHYRQETSMAATITGKPAAPEQFERTARLLLAHYCQDFINDAYSELGIHRQPGKLQLVFARPRHSISADDVPRLRAQLLELVNAARSQPRLCGTQSFPAAGPVKYSDTLTKAAIVHAADMAQQGRMDHAGSDGSSPSERLTRVGYNWRLSGENLGLGFDDVEPLMRGWLASAAHCGNIMDARFEEMGAAFAVGNDAGTRLYWVQNFAARRDNAFSRTAARR